MEIHLYNNWTQKTIDTKRFVFAGLSYHEDYYTGYTEYSVVFSLLGVQLVCLVRQYYI